MEKRRKRPGSAARKPRRRAGKKRAKGFWIILGTLIFVLLSGIVYLSWDGAKNKKSVRDRTLRHEKKKEVEAAKTVNLAPPPPPPQKKEESTPVSAARPKIAIIIDDLGNLSQVDESVLSISPALTLSVFPHLSNSKNIAEKAAHRGNEVMLHLPMEPHDYPASNPGEGALLSDMDDIAIITEIYEGIDSVPGVKGVNNHMGSRFTEDNRRMHMVMAQLKEKGLYFIDSKTSPKSRSDKIGRELGVKTAARDVFLDNEQNEAYILRQVEELKRIARKRGNAVGIAHPYPETVVALKKVLPELQKEFDIVPASSLVR